MTRVYKPANIRGRRHHYVRRGVPLYSNHKVIGGLGVSGDSACAVYVIAYRMRRNAGLDGIPAGVGFNKTDNIDYLDTNEAPTGFIASILLSRYRPPFRKHLNCSVSRTLGARV